MDIQQSRISKQRFVPIKARGITMAVPGCTCESCTHQLCAKRIPIFSGLNHEELCMVSNLITRKRYVKGEIICLEGSPVDSLIIVNSGRIKIFKDTNDGREQILYIFSQGDFFGEKNLLTDQILDYSIEALEETGICSINKDDFKKLVRKFPDIGLKIMEELIKRIDRMESFIGSMGVKSVESRVGAVLLEFAAKYGKPDPKGILVELPLSREGIANYIGLTRETVSRKLNRLQEDGILEMVGNKKVLIKSLEALDKSAD